MTPVAAFAAYCEAFAQGDGAAMAALFTDDGVFEAPTLDRPVRGRAALEKQLRIIAQSMRDISTDVRIAVEDGDKGWFEGAFHAEVIGTGFKVDGSPHRVDFRFVATVEMRDGAIARLVEFFDTRPLHVEERQRMWAINRRSPYWEASVAAGAMEWSVYNSMHFAMTYGRMPYEDYAELLEGVTLWDVGLERQTQLKGRDAHAFLDYLTCRDMSTMRPGDCRYALVCDEAGALMVDPVVLWPFEDTIWLSHGNFDLTLWARGIAMHGAWDVEVCEPDVAPLQVQGPLSLAVLAKICPAPLADMKNYTCLVTKVAGEAAVVSRTGWSGGFGFEVFPLSSARARRLWDAILEAGEEHAIKVTGPIVHRAVERGVTDFNYYMSCAMNPLEDVACHLVDLDKEADFIGRQALRRIAADGVKRHSVGLVFEGEVPRLEWFWDLQDGRGGHGVVRWAVHSFALKRSIGIAVVDKAVKVGDMVEVAHPFGTTRAEVTTIPFVDRGD
jgi:aminomethyltransferase